MHTITNANTILFRTAYFELLDNIQAASIADIGSGNGTESIKIGKKVKAQRVVCVDHDQKALIHAKKIGCEVLQADLNEPLKLRSNSFDLVLSNQVIEHVAKTDLLASEIYRILKPGGLALWCTPNLASWHNIVALIAGFQPFSSQISDEKYIGNPWHPEYQMPIYETQAHLRIFTHRSLREMLSLHGFIIVSDKGAGYYPFNTFIAKLLSKIDPIHTAYILILGMKPL
jgi:ubiquinone/menaquinone biosynthesis C-methylase UbiE